MNLEQRVDLLVKLGSYCLSDVPAWQAARQRAHHENGWFTPEFIQLAVEGIASFLREEDLRAWAASYQFPAENPAPKTVGLTMAGNIPLVGFHDFLSIFISGHRQLIKPSSRDNVLIRHLVAQLESFDPAVSSLVGFADMLKGCDAYIATGSNNSARYFDYYFGKYPHIIRRNRTSVAILTGEETYEDLELLANDVYMYFGLGCRNVTKLYVPESYDFLALLESFRKYSYLTDLAKYKHNYDYQLTVLILNKKYYMTNESILLVEAPSPFSALSVLNYEYYTPGQAPVGALQQNPDIQCIVAGPTFTQNQMETPSASPSAASSSPVPTASAAVVPFGQAQKPGLTDYADGIDTLRFLRDL